jgi:prepilin-type N-terminal cleavage/methylation domain-containing protein
MYKKSQMFKVKCQMCSKRGFSLIELLIVIAIIAIMTAVLFAGNQNENKIQNEVDAATRQLAVDLRSIQNDALNGKQDIISGNIACQANLVLVNGNPNYKINYTPISGATCTGTPFGERTVNLQNAKISSPNGEVSFSAPSGTVTATSNTIQVVSTKDSTTNTICVDTNSGNITEKKGSQACP